MQKESKETSFTTLYIALGISAAVALIYQVAVSNVLFYYFTENSYSVATVLSTFLVGLAIGSFLFYRIQTRIENEQMFFAWLQLLIATYGFVIFLNATEIIPALNTSSVYVVSFFMLLLPTTALGVVFPLTLSAIKDQKRASFVYGVDLVGAALGSLLAGFYLIPVLGNEKTILAAVLLGALSALVAFRGVYRCVPVFFFIVFIAGYLYMYGNQTEFSNTGSLESFMKPSAYGDVKVENGTLFIDGRDQCSWLYGDDATERTIVDEVFNNTTKPDAKSLNIGLGCGLTLQSILEKTSAAVDVVEINEVVVEANKSQSDILESPQVNLIVEDGVKFVAETNIRYDNIIVDITNPAIVYSADLFTQQTFADVKNSLVDNGIFGLWINRCSSELYNDIMYNTLRAAFDNVYQINANIFIASDRVLPYRAYVPYTDTVIVNTRDTNYLAREYYERCRFGENSQHYIDFESYE